MGSPDPLICKRCGERIGRGSFCSTCRMERRREQAREQYAIRKHGPGFRVYRYRVAHAVTAAPCVRCGKSTPPAPDGHCDACRDRPPIVHNALALCQVVKLEVRIFGTWMKDG